MQDSVSHDAAPDLILSELLRGIGVPHAFTARGGGVSRGMFDSLNFGNPGDLPPEHRDPPSNIAENLRRALRAMDVAGREVVQVHQVHGADVHVVATGEPSHAGPGDTRADALILSDPSRIAAVRVADCAPILLASGDGAMVAAVHAGWRGLVGGVLPRTIERMRAMGAGEMVAAVGPCIGPDAFEVGEDVAQEFRRVFGSENRLLRPGQNPGKYWADLQGGLTEQLGPCGVRFEVLPGCTVRDVADGRPRFFSHRRDGGRTGRMMALIGPVLASGPKPKA